MGILDLAPKGCVWNSGWKLEARAGIEPAMEVLQTSVLPLGYRAPEPAILDPAPTGGCSMRKTLASSEGREKTGAGDGI